MSIKNKESEIKDIYSGIEENKLVLPNFQRAYVWTKEKQKKFLASILVGLPIGSLLLLEGKSGDFSKRELCFNRELNSEVDCDYVLDGQQRLSTLRTIFYDVFDGQEWVGVWDSLYGPLRTRWFLNLTPKTSDYDCFGLENLKFEGLEKFTDSDIEDFIVLHPIHKTKDKELHHPNYKLKKSDGAIETRAAFISNHIATEFAKDALVPLWQVSNVENGLHRKVLERIASKRVDQLKTEAEHSGYSLEFYERVFSPISVNKDDIEMSLDSDDGEDRNKILLPYWARLSASWVEKVSVELERLPERKMAIIHLDRSEVNRAVAVFEAINRGGVSLSTYDLVVARSARDKGRENLTQRVIKQINDYIEIDPGVFSEYSKSESALLSEDGKLLWSAKDFGVVEGNDLPTHLKDWFVNILSLFVYVKRDGETCSVEHIKKDKILSISSDDINEYTDLAVASIVRSLAFLNLKCGVVNSKEISYKLMLVVVAYYLVDDENWFCSKRIKRLEHWYWLSIFTGQYSANQNQRCIDDIKHLSAFLSDDAKLTYKKIEQTKILNIPDWVDEEILLRKDDNSAVEPSAIKNSILQFVLSSQPVDFLKRAAGDEIKTLSAWSDDELEVHHIMPLAGKKNLGESSKDLRSDPNNILNSVLNLTYISKRANRELSSMTPAEYINQIQEFVSATHSLPSLEKFKEAESTKTYDGLLTARLEKLSDSINRRLFDLL